MLNRENVTLELNRTSEIGAASTWTTMRTATTLAMRLALLRSVKPSGHESDCKRSGHARVNRNSDDN